MNKNFLVITLFLLSLTAVSQNKKLDEIGYKIDSSFTNGNSAYFNKVFDVDLFISKFKKKSSNKSVVNFNKGFFKGLKDGFNFGSQILKEIGNGASYDFLKSYVDDNNVSHLLFRLYSEDGLNYHDFELRNKNGELKIVDAYIYIVGENLSSLIKNIYYQALLNSVQNLSKKERIAYSNVFKLLKIRNLNAKDDFKEAYNIYNNLDAKSKSSKIFKAIVLTTVQNLDEDIYLKFISDYEKDFPNDPSLFLVSIDGFLLKGKYDKSLEYIDKLDAALKGDTFLNYIRGNIYYLKKDHKKSIEYFKKINEEYPTFIDGYDSLLTVYIELKKYKEAIDILNIFIADFEISKEDLINTLKDSFPKFVETKQFKEWSKTK